MNTRRAFTLVELLTVIVIIGILATLVTLAVAGALRSAKKGRMAWEMDQISRELEHYKAEFGEYPPDFFDNEALVRHVKKRWPRYDLPSPPSGYPGTPADYQADLIRRAIGNVYGNNQDVYTPALRTEWGVTTTIGFTGSDAYSPLISLCFWLGGFPDKEGKFVGFDADPEAPFGRGTDAMNSANNNAINYGQTTITRVTIRMPDKSNMMELTVNKDVFFVGAGTNNGMIPCVVSRIGSDQVVPIVYFRGSADGGKDAYLYTASTGPTLKNINFSGLRDGTGSTRGLSDVSGWYESGFAVPYARGGNPFGGSPTEPDVIWCESTKYQLIHPGLDAHFGNQGTQSGSGGDPFNRNLFRSLEAGADANNLGAQDLDNMTNFSSYKELKSILP